MTGWSQPQRTESKWSPWTASCKRKHIGCSFIFMEVQKIGLFGFYSKKRVNGALVITWVSLGHHSCKEWLSCFVDGDDDGDEYHNWWWCNGNDDDIPAWKYDSADAAPHKHYSHPDLSWIWAAMTKEPSKLLNISPPPPQKKILRLQLQLN